MHDYPTISTHVLDTQHGQPASGVRVVLQRVEAGTVQKVGEGITDQDGRIRQLLAGDLVPGDFRLDFELDGPFFKRLSISIHVDDASRSCHVPMLVAPYALSTYRGS